MRTTLRRSCNACARAKHACDLRSPRCSRCIKRKTSCVYANEPLTVSLSSSSSLPEEPAKSRSTRRDGADMSSTTSASKEKSSSKSPESSADLSIPVDASLDPFDSYPPTRLPRIHTQRLIHHFLSTIAFQYYPLDLDTQSNPFIVSWWPLALADPALFHVSIQTASLDEELRAQKGFPISERLMADSVSLVRRKVENPVLAIQDETLNSVVTLAAIEYGKGNFDASRMHINGVKRMVGVRGGIDQVRRTSPLTARMVAWVSMLVTGSPQFPIQDDFGFGVGIGPILQWSLASTSLDPLDTTFRGFDIDPDIGNVFARLCNIIHGQESSCLTGTELHDLTCFAVHKLLLLPPVSLANPTISESLRHAMVLYLLTIHGTTYYSHANLAYATAQQLRAHLESLVGVTHLHGPLGIWILSMGMVAATGSNDQQWFISQARAASTALGLHKWADVLALLKSILWMGTPREQGFQQAWEGIFNSMTQ
ncbi:hypothetical protein ACJZ2D_004567 [Fusarium nematophilum]